tara:strand:- start:24 stop:497 length:474 start_codon:yes stop_codon:yes gene_type:complete
MLIQFEEYLTIENIYLWSNFGVLPFWILLLLVPNSKFTQFLINSIILPLIFAVLYSYLLYQAIISDDSIVEIFELYFGLDSLYTIFANEKFLLLFWIHFLFINLFIGSWASRDGIKYNIPRKLVAIPLILIYFSGPVGLVLYWIFRIFYAKRLGFHE